VNTIRFELKSGKFRFLTSTSPVLVALCLLVGCQTVKPYQRNYLNDHEMQAGQKHIAKPEQNAMSYREGASGGGGKASGGCGCN